MKEKTYKKIKHGESNKGYQCYSCERCSAGWFENKDYELKRCPNCGAKLKINSVRKIIK